MADLPSTAATAVQGSTATTPISVHYNPQSPGSSHIPTENGTPIKFSMGTASNHSANNNRPTHGPSTKARLRPRNNLMASMSSLTMQGGPMATTTATNSTSVDAIPIAALKPPIGLPPFPAKSAITSTNALQQQQHGHANATSSLKGSLTPPVAMYNKRQSPSLVIKKTQNRNRARSVSFSDQVGPATRVAQHDRKETTVNRSTGAQNGMISPNTPDGTIGLTPLMHAARSGEHEAVAALIKQGADVNLTDTRGYDALLYAIRDGHAQVANVLLEGGNIDMGLYARNHPSLSHMMYAALNGHSECINVLANHGSSLDTPDMTGFTPLMAASQNGHGEAIASLLECARSRVAGKSGSSDVHSDQTTPDVVVNGVVETGATGGETDAVSEVGTESDTELSPQHMLKARIKNVLNVDAQDRNGMTAVAYASYYGSTTAVKALVEIGGADVCIVAKNKQSPLLWTVVRGHNQVGQLLLQYGAKICDAVRIHIIKEHFQTQEARKLKLAASEVSHNGDQQHDERTGKRHRAGPPSQTPAVTVVSESSVTK